jgi:hypothetical protein
VSNNNTPNEKLEPSEVDSLKKQVKDLEAKVAQLEHELHCAKLNGDKWHTLAGEERRKIHDLTDIVAYCLKKF